MSKNVDTNTIEVVTVHDSGLEITVWFWGKFSI